MWSSFGYLVYSFTIYLHSVKKINSKIYG
uniref:Uncharacterized protein n=1 Tax=Lepeophtheirus salmonis TaxID=72036 RepID=A0A0K2U3U2_LEPSM